MALVQMVLTAMVSCRLYPFPVSLFPYVSGQRVGYDPVWGTVFVPAGILVGCDFIIRVTFNNVADIEAVGFYNAAYDDNGLFRDGFLSHGDRLFLGCQVYSLNLPNQIVNRQIDTLLIPPLLTLFSVVPAPADSLFIPAKIPRPPSVWHRCWSLP